LALPEAPDQRERLGRRIAAHRGKLGWTQQELAERLAISRVAVSHLEAGMTTPGERTVTLLAGLFKLAPHELVAGTDYPTAKADRLPPVVTQFTEVETQVMLFEAELRWLDRLDPGEAEVLLARWDATLAFLLDHNHDVRERTSLQAARRRVRDLITDQRSRERPRGRHEGSDRA
jgi:transcriptional regulator with XRE-family HTH domain